MEFLGKKGRRKPARDQQETTKRLAREIQKKLRRDTTKSCI